MHLYKFANGDNSILKAVSDRPLHTSAAVIDEKMSLILNQGIENRFISTRELENKTSLSRVNYYKQCV